MHNMKAPNILRLLFCIETLGVLLCGVSTTESSSSSPAQSEENNSTQGTGQEGLTTASSDISKASTTSSRIEDESVTKPTSLPSHGPNHNPTTTSSMTPIDELYKKECRHVLLLALGLVIVCVVLMFSNLLLCCKVCQLCSHIKTLSGDEISGSQYWLETEGRSRPAKDAQQTTVLMVDVIRPQEEAADSVTKVGEEGEKLIDAGQTGEENKKEAGDAANSQEALAGEDKEELLASSPKQQEKATDSQSAGAGAAKDEAKDVA